MEEGKVYAHRIQLRILLITVVETIGFLLAWHDITEGPPQFQAAVSAATFAASRWLSDHPGNVYFTSRIFIVIAMISLIGAFRPWAVDVYLVIGAARFVIALTGFFVCVNMMMKMDAPNSKNINKNNKKN